MVDFEIERKYTSQVSNQKDDGCCMALVIADMVSTLLNVMGTEGPHQLVLSPQPLIEDGTVSPYHFDDFVKEIGLEYINTFPFTRFKRGDWNKEEYEQRDDNEYPKQFITGLKYCEDPDKIQKKILKNYDSNGKRFPILCSMYMGEFGDNKIARDIEVSKIPYHPPSKKSTRKPNPGKKSTRKRRKPTKGNKEIPEYKHALLMVGCNTTHEDPKMHYCIVKNSYGLKWGTKGFSLVGFDALEFIMVPKYKLDEEDVSEVGCSTQIHEGTDCSKWDTPLDRETDENVIKKCIFVSDLPLFAEISYIKGFFNELKLDGVGEVEAVSLISRNDLTYTRCGIVKMQSEDDVTKVLACKRSSRMTLEIKICRYQGKEFHSEAYKKGEYKMTLTVNPGLWKISEKDYYEIVEQVCHPYSTIKLIKKNYKLTNQVQVSFQSEKDRKAASVKVADIGKHVCLLPVKKRSN